MGRPKIVSIREADGHYSGIDSVTTTGSLSGLTLSGTN